MDFNDTMPNSLILSKINTSSVGSMLIHPSAVELYNYSLVRTLSYICIDIDILSGILLLKSASLHFVLPAFFLIAIVEILRDSSMAQVVQTLAESVQHIFISGN